MAKFHMKTLVLGIVQTNCYIISNEETKEAIVIDPADDAGRITGYLKENDLTCRGILLTHGHFDHILAASKVADITGARIYAHEAEAMLLSDPEMNASSHIRCAVGLVPNVLLRDNEELSLAGFQIRVIHTPGHTGGGACYYVKEHGVLISGDTLFYEDIGRSDLPTGSYSTLVESIKTKLFVLEEDTVVYPGHGEPTTIGYEKNNNIYLR